jgi:hypothetical protein
VTHDDRIQTIINKLSGRIEDWCGRKFISTVYTNESYDGEGDKCLPLKQYPIITLSAASIDGVPLPISDTTQFRAYMDEGYLWYAPGFRAAFPLGVLVTYTAGYATIPAGLQQACIEWCIIILEGRMKDAKVKQEEMRLAMPDQVMQALQPYKRIDG